MNTLLMQQDVLALDHVVVAEVTSRSKTGYFGVHHKPGQRKP
jgi:hypothetical protein